MDSHPLLVSLKPLWNKIKINPFVLSVWTGLQTFVHKHDHLRVILFATVCVVVLTSIYCGLSRFKKLQKKKKKRKASQLRAKDKQKIEPRRPPLTTLRPMTSSESESDTQAVEKLPQRTQKVTTLHHHAPPGASPKKASASTKKGVVVSASTTEEALDNKDQQGWEVVTRHRKAGKKVMG